MPDVVYLLIAAAVVGIIHMSAPDHWVTLTVLGRSLKWNRAKLALFSLITGAGHSAISIVLGFIVVAVGLVFSAHVTQYLTEAIGAIMIIAGLYTGLRSLFRNEHSHEHAHAEAPEGEKSAARGASYFAVLGAALSPDLSILPIFLASVPVGWLLAVNTAIIFAVASILTMLLLVMISSFGMARAIEKLPPKYNDALVGFVIAAVGVYVILLG